MSENQDAVYRIHAPDAEPVPITQEDLSGLDIVVSGPNTYHVRWQGMNHQVELVYLDVNAKKIHLRSESRDYVLRVEDSLDILIERLGLQRHRSNALEVLKAPMPGLVLKLMVQPGDVINLGDPVVVLEAMKMENVIKSHGQGIVDRLLVAEGQPVEKEEILMTFK
ncbi:MAG: hypothetical protein KDC57_03645 [Saprospiraceae bacterium]|nr:hypothetical protein [Saprospiraceae bacterium]